MSKSWTPAKSVLENGVKGLNLHDVSDDSKAVSAKLHMPYRDVHPLVTPIYHSSTYVIKSVDSYLGILDKGGYIYSRLGNPTCEDTEAALNALEGGAGSLLFATGMAAITTALNTYLRPGDHIIACNPLYSATHHYLTKILNEWNIELTFVPSGCDVKQYKEAIKKNTKILYGESPCNPLISILNLEKFGQLGKETGILTMVDSTYGSPYLQQPIKYGVDVVIHSATKYIGGHSDTCAGALTTRTLDQWRRIMSHRTTTGTVLSPHDAALLTRGLKTIALRMARHSSNAQVLAEFLEAHPKVSKVYFPGLPSHPGHAVAKKQMKQFSGMIAFEMRDGFEAAKKLVEKVRLIQFAVSLGGVESLIEHPASMTHGPMVMTDKDREESWITDGLIRFSVGIEDPEDLLRDLRQALDSV